jgi:hypothetical protein
MIAVGVCPVWWNVEEMLDVGGGQWMNHIYLIHIGELPEPPNENKWENK